MQPRPLPRVVLLGPAVAAVVARVEVQGLMVLLLLLLAALLGHLGRHLQARPHLAAVVVWQQGTVAASVVAALVLWQQQPSTQQARHQQAVQHAQQQVVPQACCIPQSCLHTCSSSGLSVWRQC